MGYFIHTADSLINVDGLVVPLAWFITQEAAYTLPSGYVSREYHQSAQHVLYSTTGQADGGSPWTDGDAYIANKATYQAAYTAYLAAQALPQTLADAKTYQINLMRAYALTIQDNGVTVGGITYKSSAIYYDRWKNEHDYAVRNSALLTSYYLTDISGNQVLMPSVAVLTGIIDNVDKFNWNMQQVIDFHEIGINAINTTIADVLAYDYTTHWATTPYDAGLSFYASYASSINADYAGGSVAGTAFGGAAIAGAYLDLAHNDARYVSYDGTSNVDAQQVGTVLIEAFKPNYSGTPASTQVIFSIAKANANSTNLIKLSHLITTGHLQLVIKDQADSAIATIDLGAWVPVSGTDYKITVHYDITAGDSWVLIDDVQIGTTNASTGTRSALIDLLRVGSGYNSGAAETSNFKIKKIHVSNQ